MAKNAQTMLWKPEASMLPEHIKLRDEMGVRLPQGSPRIMLFIDASHHTRDRTSIVATRSPDGLWHIDGAGRESSNMIEIEPRDWRPAAQPLTAEGSSKLDQLLEDKCLYAAPTRVAALSSGVGMAFRTLEVEKADGHWTWVTIGIDAPLQEAIIKLISPK